MSPEKPFERVTPDMSLDTQIAGLLKQARLAETGAEQRDLVRQATELQNQQIEAKRASNEWRAEDAHINDTLVPGRVHELHTASTDWITELDTDFDAREASHKMIAEASLWFEGKSDEVKSYGDEFREQAKNAARRLAGQFGDAADVAERAFTDEADRLRSTAVRSGLVVEAMDDDALPESSATPDMNSADASNATDDPMSSTGSAKTAASGLAEVGQEGYPTDTAFPATNGTLPPEATSSNRAPALMELQGTPSQDVVPANDPGLNNQAGFPQSGNYKESSMSVTQCPTCGGHGRVAVKTASLPSIGDIAKFAASGLDQLEQIADPKDNPKPANELSQGVGVDVAFPWQLNPTQQVPAAISQAEQQISQRNQQSPLLKGSSQQHEATGRDNSGWIGDAGARGTDYPGEQAPTGDASSSEGYVDPVYGHGGDAGNQPILPYGHQESDDYTNRPAQWAVGQPTQADNGWREAVLHDPTLQSAIAYVEQRRQAHLRSGR